MRRVRRIVPPFYAAIFACTLASLMVYCLAGPSWWNESQPFQGVFPLNSATALDFALHAALLHGLSNQFIHTIDGAFWSLSLEWQFYWAFPLLIYLARRFSIIAAVALPLLVALVYYAAAKLLYPSFMLTWLGREIIFARWSEFGAGMASAYATANMKSVGVRNCTWFSVPMFVVAIAVEALRPNGFAAHQLWGVAFALLLIVVLKVKWASDWLSKPAIVWIGTASYSLYLIHGTVFRLIAIPLSRMEASPAVRSTVFILLGIPLSIAVGRLFFHLFERPFLHRPSQASEQSLAGAVALSPAP